jgi:translation elongation factor P/translation initiation factor 5A
MKFCTLRARELLKPGSVIKLNEGPHKVIKITHGKRGKGGGFVKAKLKNITKDYDAPYYDYLKNKYF